MFTFFQKKIFLADYLHGLVDIHNHILPGIDDGAKTVQDSLYLINEFKKVGITNFICTPHIMHNYYPNTPATIQNSFNKLRIELENQNMKDISIQFSAEHMIDDNFETILRNGEVVPLKNDYLLVEMSYLQPSINFEQAIEEVAKRKYFPILAHPERYAYFHQKSKVYQSLKNQGVLLQLNLLSLTANAYGNGVHKCAQKLLEDGLIHFVASDVHNIQQLRMIKEAKISSATLKKILPVIENTIRTFY
ncbi:tyrosine-protein phosphatase [Flagellimonas sp.]|uniref:tyrosine-protein phosphatase n=1 Tax=Flagellimonas sp. TaxID=2058762 RepID=UPI003B502EB4